MIFLTVYSFNGLFQKTMKGRLIYDSHRVLHPKIVVTALELKTSFQVCAGLSRWSRKHQLSATPSTNSMSGCPRAGAAKESSDVFPSPSGWPDFPRKETGRQTNKEACHCHICYSSRPYIQVKACSLQEQMYLEYSLKRCCTIVQVHLL